MASIIRIKRSSTSGNPSTLGAGELAYSALGDNGSNGGDRLYIGMGTETSGNAVNHVVIGGKYFTDMLDHSKGTLTANSALIVDSSKKLDELLVDNLSLNGNTLSSSTGDLILNGATGVVLQGSEFIAGGSYNGNRLYLPTGSGATLRSGYEGGVSLQAATDGSSFVTLNLAASGTLTIPGTIVSTSGSNNNITITPDGTGKTVISNLYINDTSTPLSEYIFDTVGGAVTAGTGITVTASDVGNTTTISVTNTTVTAGSYGSTTKIPTFTVNAQGQLTAAGEANLATSLSIAGDTGTDTIALLSDTLTFTGGTGITSTVTNNAVDFSIDSTVATLTGTQTLTNKTINLANNTLVATSAQLATAITDETGSGSLVFANTPTLITPVLGAATATSITATSGNLTLSAASGNNNVNLIPTGTGIVDVGGKRVGNAADPQQAQDLVTKAYVDAMSNGLDVKASVRAATTGPLTATYTAGTSSGGGGSPVTYHANGVGHSGDFAYFPTEPDPWGVFWYTAGYLEINLAGWSNTEAFNNLLLVGSGVTLGVDPAGYGFLVDFTSTSGWTAQGGGLYRMTGTWGAGGPTSFDSGITDISFTYSPAPSDSGEGATLTNADTQAALTLDSIALAVGDRVLIKNQADAMENGVYVVTTVGSASVNWVLTRASDFDNSPTTEISPGTFFFVEQGTTQADNGYVISTDDVIVVGTSDIIFSQFSGAGQITAGAGLTKSGNTLNVVGTADRITVSTDSVDIASTYVGQSTITTLGTIGTGVWQGTVVAGQYGGTGVANTGKTITLGGSLTTSGAYTTTLTVTADTSVTLPSTGTLATLAGTESLSNKTITSSSFSGTTITGSGLIAFTNATDAGPLGTAAVVMSGGLSVSKKIYVGTDLIGAGADTSTLSGFDIDGGTY